MYMASELDAGDIIKVEKTKIGADETAGELTERLSHLGARALHEAVEEIAAGTAARCSGASRCQEGCRGEYTSPGN